MLSVIAKILHVSVNLGKTTNVAVEVAEIDVAVAVTVCCPVEEEIIVAFYKPDRVERLSVLLVIFCKQSLDKISGLGVVYIESCVLLAAVKYLYKNLVTLWSPAYIRKVLVVSEVVSLDVYSSAGCHVIYSETYVFRVHSGHRVLDLLEASGPGGDVQKRECGDLGLILAVKGKSAPVRAPEDATLDAEFVAMDGFTVDDFKKVIDTKTAEWKGTDMEQYLRPETLFSASKFEGYLNQRTIKKTSKNDFNNFDQHDYDMDELTKRAKRR